MLRLLIVPLTRPLILDFIDFIKDEVSTILSKSLGENVEVLIWPSVENPPMKCFDWDRRQYLGSCIIEWLHSLFHEYTEEYIVVGIGYLDGYEPGLNFIFGEALPSLKICIVFTKRLNPTFYSLKYDYNLYLQRIVKEVIHELGHVLGLNHCTNRRCVMSFSNTIYDVDEKSAYFCDKCIAKIKSYISSTK
ncbi:archaemetzincin family Zn-dependent metalloprotease [Desulfurococcaceae archaeon MEX13E-LK6-19]|nr:archaemetzincin family Zn-dependent metalloprotease [Desulfurococcaceae archaeon MEX13E-LK6-19]